MQEVAHRAVIAIDNARLYKAAQEAVRARDEFLTVATHELDTPMTSLTLTLEAVRRALEPGRRWDPHAMGRQVDRALRQATRLTRLHDELLDVSRSQEDRLTLEVAEVDLEAVVRDVIARLKLDLAGARPLHEPEDRGRARRLDPRPERARRRRHVPRRAPVRRAAARRRAELAAGLSGRACT
ncbi:uncharacterized protein SOCE836_054890 [Sorangium cellulosum]|uniref:histidine kinase n=1 Tax=Sorangium cellulosum TaxID=56 RepID=A0A4V0NGI9_SORCE|nr:uncharacterized protein SOCE836_054890 [Sorangium cellulosum]WCQ92646.1 hypothetical protein NQZ70_05389 [Sorangium sp. Soce836]